MGSASTLVNWRKLDDELEEQTQKNLNHTLKQTQIPQQMDSTTSPISGAADSPSGVGSGV